MSEPGHQGKDDIARVHVSIGRALDCRLKRLRLGMSDLPRSVAHPRHFQSAFNSSRRKVVCRPSRDR
jgi:hypothetical protein